MAIFDEDWLEKQGVTGTEDELCDMADILYDELQIRIGSEVLDSLTPDQVKEFETLMDKTKEADMETVRNGWISKHYPDYDKTTTAQKIKLSRQFKAAKDKQAFVRSLAD